MNIIKEIVGDNKKNWDGKMWGKTSMHYGNRKLQLRNP
jgi:hypothetical protein